MKKNNMRFYVTITIVKIATKILKLLGRNATHLPGWLANQLCPDFLGHLEKPETLVYITGTNGKTTVSNLTAEILRDNGYNFANNASGSNVSEGLVSALLSKSSFFGKANEKLAILEVDERYSPLIYPYMQPDIFLCTNLCRDALDRNANVDFIVDILNTNISDHTKMILNGDDLIVSHLKPDNERVYFGIDKLPRDSKARPNIVRDIIVCPDCDTPLEYDFLRYNHVGRAHCPNCGYGSPEVNYDVTSVDEEKMEFTIKTATGEETYRLLGKNITDVYNELTAITLLHELGLTYEQIFKSMNKMKLVASRYNVEKVGNKEVIMCLAKGQSPIASSRVFEFIAEQGGNSAVVLLNYDYHDDLHSSENMAWIYEADYEFLNTDSVKQIIPGGKRCYDYQLRALLAGVSEERIECALNPEDVVKLVNLSEVDKIYILHAVYTRPKALEIKEHLIKRIQKGEK
ncbi:MAG: Mur ligase family protein [Clostridia bacterium]|nr:MurT ligase domain-containing protein [Lachnospiraceae bacterium]NCB99086.1 Mur ligase family protein [Clostridia bacterium]NCD02142.1 Mur ligase family protein [Clostridia bacterium]